jgi:hypothetical protein
MPRNAVNETYRRATMNPLSDSLFFGLIGKQRFEIAVERFKEVMNFQEIVDRDRFLRIFVVLIEVLKVEKLAISFERNFDRTIRPKSEQRICVYRRRRIANDRGEAARVTILALHDHEPDVGLAGHDLDIVFDEAPVTDGTPVHAFNYDTADLVIGSVHCSRCCSGSKGER